MFPLSPVSKTLLVLVTKFATYVVDTGGKFSTNCTSGKYAASIVDTGGKFATGVIDTGGAPTLGNISANSRINLK